MMGRRGGSGRQRGDVGMLERGDLWSTSWTAMGAAVRLLRGGWFGPAYASYKTWAGVKGRSPLACAAITSI